MRVEYYLTMDPAVESSASEATASQLARSEDDDLISSLPLGILLWIVEYLDLADLLRSQIVGTDRSSETSHKS